jgi:hypothetical protein
VDETDDPLRMNKPLVLGFFWFQQRLPEERGSSFLVRRQRLCNPTG